MKYLVLLLVSCTAVPLKPEPVLGPAGSAPARVDFIGEPPTVGELYVCQLDTPSHMTCVTWLYFETRRQQNP